MSLLPSSMLVWGLSGPCSPSVRPPKRHAEWNDDGKMGFCTTRAPPTIIVDEIYVCRVYGQIRYMVNNQQVQIHFWLDKTVEVLTDLQSTELLWTSTFLVRALERRGGMDLVGRECKLEAWQILNGMDVQKFADSEIQDASSAQTESSSCLREIKLNLHPISFHHNGIWTEQKWRRKVRCTGQVSLDSSVLLGYCDTPGSKEY